MGHFARVPVIENGRGVVETVIVADQEYIDTKQDRDMYFKTSRNTYGGVHYDPDTNLPSQDQSKAFRKNFAAPGFTLDLTLDAFIPPAPYPSWVLNPESCLWNPPVAPPTDGGSYRWDEGSLSWQTVTYGNV